MKNIFNISNIYPRNWRDLEALSINSLYSCIKRTESRLYEALFYLENETEDLEFLTNYSKATFIQRKKC